MNKNTLTDGIVVYSSALLLHSLFKSTHSVGLLCGAGESKLAAGMNMRLCLSLSLCLLLDW